MEIEKYEDESGQTAVLVSHGYGAGWSTWGNNSEFLAMDKGLVEMKMAGATQEEVERYCTLKLGEAPYMGGWNDTAIEWLAKGTHFYINEYDGSEIIILSENLNMIA